MNNYSLVLQRAVKELMEGNEMKKSKEKYNGEGRINIKAIALSMHIKYAQ